MGPADTRQEHDVTAEHWIGDPERPAPSLLWLLGAVRLAKGRSDDAALELVRMVRKAAVNGATCGHLCEVTGWSPRKVRAVVRSLPAPPRRFG